MATGKKQRLGEGGNPLQPPPRSPRSRGAALGWKGLGRGGWAPGRLTWRCSTPARRAALGGRLCTRTAGCCPRGPGRRSRRRGRAPARWTTGVRRTRSRSWTACRQTAGGSGAEASGVASGLRRGFPPVEGWVRLPVLLQARECTLVSYTTSVSLST